jgi:hypothetical protein
VLDTEDVAVEIGDPLLALDGQLEIAERVSDAEEEGVRVNSLTPRAA